MKVNSLTVLTGFVSIYKQYYVYFFKKIKNGNEQNNFAIFSLHYFYC